MRRRRPAAPAPAPAPVLASAVAAATALLVLAPPASAAPTDKPQVLSRWTQTSAASHRAWAEAREKRNAWTAYGFDWTTDYCTSSPDNPFGFPFHRACARHDFGYRNHTAAGLFRSAKPRLDDAFHADLRRVCAQYSGARKASCDSTAWTYYQAVKLFGIS
ncbi:phospholipase [Streptomyces sp. NPDC003038]|uniref:phospholipase n=1 Tax=unclassified Streptomyces TaxID=2593676 RepID=UPI0033AA63FB